MSFNSRYAKEEKKTFTPPEGVQSAARKALKWIEEGHAGGGFTGVGRGRAHQLANGESVSLSTIKRMHSYFSRHRVDKKGKDWDKPSPGKVAWYAWGGDAGAAWAKSIAEKHSDTKKESSFDEHYAFEKTAHDPGSLTYNPKEAVNLNVVHDVATMAPHVWNGIKDVGHGIADVAKGVGHGVSSIGHNDIDLVKSVGESLTAHNPDNSPNNINHILYNYLNSPSVGRFPVGTPNHEIYNIVQHWRMNGGQRGGNALHNYPGLDKIFPGQGKASGEVISQDLKNKFDAINLQGENHFMADMGSAALTGLVPTAIGLGIKQHRDNKFSSFDEHYAFEKTAHDPGILQPIFHGLSQIGHGVGNAVKDLAHQMVQPVTHRFTGDPNHLKRLWDQANAIGGQHDPNGVAQENAMNAWEQYGQGHTTNDYHLPGIGADLGAASTFGYGLYRLLRPQASTFTYNSKNAVRDYNYYERSKPISPFNGRKNCGRCDIEIPKGSPLLQDGTFGPVCRDCNDVLKTKPEE